MTKKGFSVEEYHSLLSGIDSAGYDFRRLDEESGEQTMYLRHDVDHSPVMARRLGEVESERGIQSSFFFLLGADAYRLLSEDVLDLMRHLQELGHLVGLHLDERRIGKSEKDVVRTIRWFDQTILSVSDVFAFHRPTEDVLGKRYNTVTSAYGPDLFDVHNYASDSRRNTDFWVKLDRILEEERSPSQLLLHPAWWCDEDSVASIGWMIASRREREVRKHLLDDWEAVFRGVLPVGEGKEIV